MIFRILHVLLVVGIGALAFSIGLTTAGITVAPGSEGENGDGESTSYLASWVQVAVANDVIPASVPAAVNTTVGAPTVLPSTNQSFVVNAATAGHAAVRWDFNETLLSGSLRGIEFRIDFTIVCSSGCVPLSSQFSVYLQFQAASPPFALIFHLYWDSGTAGAISVTTAQQVSLACRGPVFC